MTALTKERDTPRQHYHYPVSLLMAANGKVFNGGMVNTNATGYAVAASDTAGHKMGGIARETVDNTGGADGALRVDVIHLLCTMANPAGANQLTQADLGKLCYVFDDQTVIRAAGTVNSVIAGAVRAVDTVALTCTFDTLIKAV